MTPYEHVSDARRDRLFERGWLPDVLPDNAGPLVEAHNIDTNARCAHARFASDLFDKVLAALSREGFQRYQGKPAPIPLRVCPFTDDDVRNASIVLHRRGPNGGQEFAALGADGKFVFWAER